MSKKIMTLDNLYQFFVEQNKAVNFSSRESGKPIVVLVPGNFEVSNDDMPGMLKTKIKVCHTELNRNGSFISKENMEKAMPTLKYRPILAYIHQLEDGTFDFYAHNIEIVEDENGEEQIIYQEKQVGCFTADEPTLEYDEDMDKTYVIAYGVIPEEYTQAADIIRRKNGTKVSCELVINELSYNAKEKYLDLTDFYFGGTTLLGCDEDGNEIGEGMLGARADISDFCCKEPTFSYQDKLIETLKELNFTLKSFNNKNSNKGGEEDMGKFEELLAKYGKTSEDISFEIEGLSDEELEIKFEEVFGEVASEEPIVDDEEVVENEEIVEDETDTENEETVADSEDEDTNNDFKKKRKKCSIDENGNMSVSFEISHEEITYALYNLIEQYDEVDNDFYLIRSVYDNYFIMQGWCNQKLYKQSYVKDGDNVALEGDRQEMFEMILTESEKLTIEKLREDYSALEIKYNELAEFKANYDAAQLKAQKDAILSKVEYECLAEDEAFKTLIADKEKYSVEDLSVKADLIFAAYVKTNGAFSAKTDGNKAPKVINIPFNKTEEKKGPYNGLFD